MINARFVLSREGLNITAVEVTGDAVILTPFPDDVEYEKQKVTLYGRNDVAALQDTLELVQTLIAGNHTD